MTYLVKSLRSSLLHLAKTASKIGNIDQFLYFVSERFCQCFSMTALAFSFRQRPHSLFCKRLIGLGLDRSALPDLSTCYIDDRRLMNNCLSLRATTFTPWWCLCSLRYQLANKHLTLLLCRTSGNALLILNHVLELLTTCQIELRWVLKTCSSGVTSTLS